ncbi:MAG: ROK family protein [Bryobacteraceae bacterium]|nr:ROK family protein [Bryobacteraceae bacterium]
MSSYTIGLDLGGTNLRAAAFSADGQLLDQVARPTDVNSGREAVINNMVEAIDSLRRSFAHRQLLGVGIGVPGFIRLREGVIVGSNNLKPLEDFPLRDAISEKLGTSVILENDANAAALGEKWQGAGRAVNNLVMFTLGTGIGGGIIHHGRVMHGADGMAGELGHITVHPEGNPCDCGNRGCLEKHASAMALMSMAKLIRLGDDLTPVEIAHYAKQGDTRAIQVFESMGRALGIGLATVINTFNFPLYLLAGGLLPAWELFAPTMLAEVERRSFTFRNAHARIEQATLGNQAGLYGAAYLPHQPVEAD